MTLTPTRPPTSRARRAIAGAFACGALLALPACHIPQLRPADPAHPLPATFNGAACPENSGLFAVDEFYQDPHLLALIDQALADNQELKVLEQDVEIAGNEVLSRRGEYLPFVGGRAGAGLDKASRFTTDGAVEDQLEAAPGRDFPDPVPDYFFGLNVFWQIDIWRELRNARDAAQQRYFAAIDRRADFVTRLVADVAENYFTLLALDQRVQIIDQTIALQEQSLKVAEAAKEAARGTELGVQRFLAEVRKNRSERLIVAQEIIETENRVNFLAGRFPQAVGRASGEFLDLTLRPLAVGVPADLLANRPDVRRAERELAATGLDVQVARARFFPRVDLTAGIGYRAFNPRYLFDPEAIFYNLAGDLTAPLINKKAIRADYMTANARQLQAVYDYQRTVLNAFTEVVNRVTRADNFGKSVAVKKLQLDSLRASVDVAGKLFQNAKAEYIEVLFAQRDLMEARMVTVDTKREQLTAVVNAYQALGGGYLRTGPSHSTSGLPLPAVMNEPSVTPDGQPLPAPRELEQPPKPPEGRDAQADPPGPRIVPDAAVIDMTLP